MKIQMQFKKNATDSLSETRTATCFQVPTRANRVPSGLSYYLPTSEYVIVLPIKSWTPCIWEKSHSYILFSSRFMYIFFSLVTMFVILGHLKLGFPHTFSLNYKLKKARKKHPGAFRKKKSLLIFWVVVVYIFWWHYYFLLRRRKEKLVQRKVKFMGYVLMDSCCFF